MSVQSPVWGLLPAADTRRSGSIFSGWGVRVPVLAERALDAHDPVGGADVPRRRRGDDADVVVLEVDAAFVLDDDRDGLRGRVPRRRVERHVVVLADDEAHARHGVVGLVRLAGDVASVAGDRGDVHALRVDEDAHLTVAVEVQAVAGCHERADLAVDDAGADVAHLEIARDVHGLPVEAALDLVDLEGRGVAALIGEAGELDGAVGQGRELQLGDRLVADVGQPDRLGAVAGRDEVREVAAGLAREEPVAAVERLVHLQLLPVDGGEQAGGQRGGQVARGGEAHDALLVVADADDVDRAGRQVEADVAVVVLLDERELRVLQVRIHDDDAGVVPEEGLRDQAEDGEKLGDAVGLALHGPLPYCSTMERRCGRYAHGCRSVPHS